MLSAVPAREDPRDVLVSLHAATINTLPPGARVGTSSLRRQSLLLHLRPDVRVELLRGNVDTRLRKLEAGVVDATILAAAGLKRLGSRYVIAALSNGNVALLTNMAKNAGLHWDCILSAENARHYKPDPEVYKTAAELLGIPPEQILMVAAHLHDLRGAQTVGFRTAFVPRLLEFGPNGSPDSETDPTFDITATDFSDLAHQLVEIKDC